MTNIRLSIRRILPPWLNGLWGGIAVFFTLFSVVYVGWLYFHWGGEENVTLTGNLLNIPLDLVASVAAWHVYTQKDLNPRIRRMWLLLGLGLLSYCIADLIWAYLENVWEVPPFPAISDLFYLLFPPLAIAGLLSLPSKPLSQPERRQFITEMLVIMTATGMLMWHFVIQPTAIASAGDLVSQAVSVAYPVADLVFITGIVATLLRQSDRNTRSALWLLLLGMAFFVGSDIVYGYTSLAGTYASGGWVDAGWNIAHLFFIYAALRHIYRAPESEEPRWMTRMARGLRGLLYLTVVFAFGLTVYVGIRGFYDRSYIWLFAGAGALLLLLIGQQVVSPAFRNSSLRTKLVSAFLIVTLIPILVQFFQNNNSTRQILTHSANTALSGAAAQTASRLDVFIADGLNNVRTAAQSNIWQEYLTLSPAERTGSELEQVLYIELRAQARRDQTYIDAVGLMDKNGIDVADTATGEIGSDKSTHRYVAEPFRTGLPYSTIQFSPTTSRLSVYFSAPVRDVNGNILGVLRIRYQAEVLQQIITQSAAKLGLEGSELILLDENHIRLAVSDAPELIMKSVAPLPADKLAQLQTEHRLPAERPAEELSTNLPEFEQGLSNITSQPFFAAETKPEEYESAEDVTGEQIAVARLETQPWLVAAAQQQSFYLAPLTEETSEDVGSTFLTMILVAIAALFVAQTISKPIVQLRNVVAQIASGNMQSQAPVSSNDETGQLASAFNNMTDQLRKSFEDLDRRAKEITTMAEVSRQISTIMDHRRLVDEVVERVNSAFHYYHTQIYFYDPTGNELLLAGGTGEVGRTLLERGHKILKGKGLVGRAAETNTPVFISDVSNDRQWLPNPLLPETKSEIAVPISSGGTVSGVLDVQHDKAGGLTNEDVDVIQSIANQIMIASQNGRLLTEAQNRAQREALITSINQKIQSTTTVENALQIAVREVGHALGTQARVRLVQSAQKIESK